MPTTKQTPDDLRAKAEKLATQAAEVQAEIDAQTMREYEAEQAEQRKAAQTLVDSFDSAALDRDVDDARQALDQAVSEMPVTQALAGYLSAQWVRNWAHVDLAGARGLLGLPTTGGRQSSTYEITVEEIITTIARRDAQRHVDAHREGQS
jgi:hypothetical protein